MTVNAIIHVGPGTVLSGHYVNCTFTPIEEDDAPVTVQGTGAFQSCVFDRVNLPQIGMQPVRTAAEG